MEIVGGGGGGGSVGIGRVLHVADQPGGSTPGGDGHCRGQAAAVGFGYRVGGNVLQVAVEVDALHGATGSPTSGVRVTIVRKGASRWRTCWGANGRGRSEEADP